MNLKYYLVVVLLFLAIRPGYATVSCGEIKRVCLEPDSTKYFDGKPLYAKCWKWQITSECKSDSENNCEVLRKQGCYQVSSSCKESWKGSCVVQEEIFKCGGEECKETEEEVCLENVSCMDGSCTSTTPEKSKKESFGKAASGLAVLAEAGKEFKENNKDSDNVKNVFVFTGKAMECSENLLNFKNCCGGSGWGEGWLASCDADEKELAQKRGAGLTVSVGDYCHNRLKPTNICTSRHYVYCVFPSKIARIIQEKGRMGQLHINFGNVGEDSSNPDCRGLTPDELSKIHFDQIDFGELTDDLLKSENKAYHPQTRFDEAKSKVKYEDAKKKSAGKGVTDQQQVAGRIKDFYDRTKK